MFHVQRNCVLLRVPGQEKEFPPNPFTIDLGGEVSTDHVYFDTWFYVKKDEFHRECRLQHKNIQRFVIILITLHPLPNNFLL